MHNKTFILYLIWLSLQPSLIYPMLKGIVHPKLKMSHLQVLIHIRVNK